VSKFLLQVIVCPYRLSVRDTINFGISRCSYRLAMEGCPASSVSVNATPAIEATSASTDATIATVCDWQVAPILQFRPGAKRRRERNAFRHRDCTVIIHIYAVCVHEHRQAHADSDGRGVPVLPRGSRAQGVLCRGSYARQVSERAAYDICGSYGTYALSRISLADIWKAASGGICA